jgi:hypothetical protein
MYKYLLVLIWLLGMNSLSAAEEGPGIRLLKDTQQVDSLFRAHLAKRELYLFMQGGITPLKYSQADLSFQKKYRVSYYDFGCVVPNYDLVSYYNSLVFSHLNQRYKGSWKENIRGNVVGYPLYRNRQRLAGMHN